MSSSAAIHFHDQRAVGVQRGHVQMVGQSAVVHDAELEPVVGHFEQGAGDGRVPRRLDGLAVVQKLFPRVIRSGHVHAAGRQHLPVYEQVLPVAGAGHRVMLAVRGFGQHGGLHVGSVIGIFLPYLLDGDHASGAGQRVHVRVGEEKQHVRLGAGLEVRQHLGFPSLVGGGGVVNDHVPGGGLIGRHRAFEVGAVAVVSAVGGDHGEGQGLRCRGGVAAWSGRGISNAGGRSQSQRHDERQCSPPLHAVRLPSTGRARAYNIPLYFTAAGARRAGSQLVIFCLFLFNLAQSCAILSHSVSEAAGNSTRASMTPGAVSATERVPAAP